LNGGPIFGVGADIDVQLDVSVGLSDAGGWKAVSKAKRCAEGLLTAGEVVQKADVKEGVGVRCEGHSLLSDHVLRFPIFISNSIFDLGV
jgi:hypothetical protein